MKASPFVRLIVLSAFSFLLVSAFSVPLSAVAGPLDDPIVPACHYVGQGGVGFAGACQLCDLVHLAQNLVQFAVAFSVIAATLLFAYAGVLYFTAASNPDNIKKAHGVFVKVFVGLIIILIAWILVDVIMKTLASNEISAPWKEIGCIQYPNTQHGLNSVPSVSASGDSTGGGAGATPAQEQAARQALGVAHICISASGYRGCDAPPCGGSTYEAYRAAHGTGCTNVGKLSNTVITQLGNIQSQCGAVHITGGTEAGHAGGSQHNTGNAVDIEFDATQARCIKSHVNSFDIAQICTQDAAFQYGANNCSENEPHLHLGF